MEEARVDHKDIFCEVEEREGGEEGGQVCIDPEDELQLSLSTLNNRQQYFKEDISMIHKSGHET